MVILLLCGTAAILHGLAALCCLSSTFLVAGVRQIPVNPCARCFVRDVLHGIVARGIPVVKVPPYERSHVFLG